MKSELELDGGGSATLLEIDGERLTLLAPRAFPPGSTLTCSSAATGKLEIKVRGCRKDAEAFRVDGRFVNLSRTQREALRAL
jgi:hypothetical protein